MIRGSTQLAIPAFVVDVVVDGIGVALESNPHIAETKKQAHIKVGKGRQGKGEGKGKT